MTSSSNDTAPAMEPDALAEWHRIVRDRAPERLVDLLAADATFHSPIVHRPQQGRDLVTLYLTGAMHVLGNDSFSYVREVVGNSDAVLEFETDVEGTVINGVDMIRWNGTGKITDFKVMIRPLRAINLVHERMAALLAAATSTP